MQKLREPAFVLLCWACLALPIVESYTFVHRAAPLQGFFGVHGGTAFALFLTAIATITARESGENGTRGRWLLPIGLVVAGGLDVAMQWSQGADYLLSSMLQPFHIVAVGLLIWHWVDVAADRAPSYGARLVVVGAPIVTLWGIAATWSPVVAVYADQYGGGDTLVSHGATCLLAFVASLILTARRSGSGHPTAWVFLGVMVVLGVSQALIADTWRFLPLFVMTGLCVEGMRVGLPRNPRVMLIGIACVWLLGYMATLHSTTMIAWDMTTWTGVCSLGILLAVVLSVVQFEATEVTQ